MSTSADLALGAVPGSTLGGDTLDLNACDREPIHIPGSIQPHGVLLVADIGTREIVGGAGAIEAWIGDDWLGAQLDTILGQPLDDAVAATAEAGHPLPIDPVEARAGMLDATLHVVDRRLVVELEAAPARPLAAAAVLAELDAAGASFERATDLQSLCDRAATIFRQLTGFDRVMVYRFLDDDAGAVLAEDRDPAMASFLNHHFPASDIPKQARALYIRNRVRVIADVDYQPAPLRPAAAGLSALDLGDAGLRSVSPIHVQYLRNMGVSASASVSIVKDGLLWGLIACHHRAPRTIPYVLRQACRALAGGLARQIRAKEEAEVYRSRIRLRGTEDALLSRLDPDARDEETIGDLAEDLRRMLAADGFAAVQDGRIVTAGRCPAEDDIARLAAWAAPRAALEPLATHNLPGLYPAASVFAPVASGLLAIALPAEAASTLLWFRAERPQVIEWAGNPHKAVSVAPGEQLSPRASFEAWREEVRDVARPWTLTDIEAAKRLRRSLTDSRQRRRLRELNRELGLIIADKEALIAQKDHLLREVSHRVQNSLQLVQSFLALQAREGRDADWSGPLAEAQRRVAAVALVHRRLYQADQVETVDLSRYLDELVGETRESMGPEWADRITLDLAPMLISADRAVQVGLILTELVINANKYAYGGAPGAIAISLEQYRNQFRLIVADQGSGVTRTRQGFGTRMMDALVQRLGGTIEQSGNDPGLRVIVTAPIS